MAAASDRPSSWAVVVVHFRDPAAVVELLDDLGGWSIAPDVVVVVDNSGDLALPARHGRAAVVRAPTNPGYAAAMNLGTARARALVPGLGLVLACTQDARLAPDAAARLVRTIAGDPAIALVGPLLVFAGEPDVVFSRGGALDRRGRATHLGRGERVAAHPVVDVDWLDGAVNLVRVDALEAVGGWDEQYFLYVEEVDLQWRLRAAGFRVVLVGDAVGRQQPGAYPAYLRFRNQIRFTDKFRESFRPWPWRHELVRQVGRSLRDRRADEVVGAVRGIRAGHRAVSGPPPVPGRRS